MAGQTTTNFLSEQGQQNLLGQLAKLRELLVAQNSALLIQNPQLAELINARVDELLTVVDAAESKKAPPADGGLAQLVGLGADAATDLSQTRAAPSVQTYDEVVTPERINAAADL